MGRLTMRAPQPSGDYEPIPAGTHVAVCFGVVDLGTHEEQFGTNPARDVSKIFLCWELVNETVGNTGQNRTIGQQYTASLHEKSKLRAVLKSWRGRDLAANEEFDFPVLLGKPCLLGIGHKPVGDKTYVELNSVSAIPKGTQVTKPSLLPFSFEIGQDTSILSKDYIPRVYGKTVLDVLSESKELGGKKLDAITAGIGGDDGDEEIAF